MEPVLENQTEIILDSIADGVFTVDADFKITSFNHAAETITGIDREEAVVRSTNPGKMEKLLVPANKGKFVESPASASA